MRVYYRAAMAAAFATFCAMPALAAWDRIGSVDFDSRLERESQFAGFGGPVENLQLRAVGNDIACRTVRVRFGDRTAREIWSGTLRVGRPKTVSMPGDARIVRGLEFVCMSKGPGGGRIDIVAERDRGGGWRPQPGPGPVPWPPQGGGWSENNWIALGSARFANQEGETTVDGAYGRHIAQIGIRPAGGDAQCRAMVIRYTNGERQIVDVNGGGVMQESRLYRVDLPGRRRNILRLALACRAVRSPAVSIQVYANK